MCTHYKSAVREIKGLLTQNRHHLCELDHTWIDLLCSSMDGKWPPYADVFPETSPHCAPCGLALVMIYSRCLWNVVLILFPSPNQIAFPCYHPFKQFGHFSHPTLLTHSPLFPSETLRVFSRRFRKHTVPKCFAEKGLWSCFPFPRYTNMFNEKWVLLYLWIYNTSEILTFPALLQWLFSIKLYVNFRTFRKNS